MTTTDITAPGVGPMTVASQIPASPADPIQRYVEKIVAQTEADIEELHQLKLEIVRLREELRGAIESADMWRRAYEGKFTP